MGLEIGFNLYKKGPLDEKGEFVEAEVPGISNWACGWSTPTEAWGRLFSFGENSSTVPVFQEGLAKIRKQVLEEYEEEYKLVDFEDFAFPVTEAIHEVTEEANEMRSKNIKEAERVRKDIADLRELQRGCAAEDNEYAFERWGEEIRYLKERLEYLEESISEDANDCYEVSRARRVAELLKEMERFVDADEYYVIPFFSC